VQFSTLIIITIISTRAVLFEKMTTFSQILNQDLEQRKLIFALLFIQSIFSLKLAAISLFVLTKREVAGTRLCYLKITQPSPQVFSVNGSIICWGLRF